MFIDKFTGSDRYIIDYLVEEVLSGLPDEVRDFMLKIAIFERFCPEICELVTGNSDSIRILNYMEQNNLFLIPLDNQREWFRYHHLFREFLFKNLKELKNNEIKNLHNKAFKWLKENGYETEAFNHCIMAKNFDQAAEYLSMIAPDLFSESGGTILKNSLERLPDKIVNKKPVLCCYSVFMKVMAGDFESSDLLYQDIFKANKVVSGFISTVKGYQYFYQTGEFEKSIEEIKNAIELLSGTHAYVREMSELILFLALRYSGDLMSVLNCCSKLMNDDSINIFTAINYADTLVEKGELSRALSVLDKSLEEEKLKYGEELRAEYSYLYIIKAEILRERNQIAEALKYCQKGLHLARNIEFLEFIFLGNLVYAKILAADSNFVEADKAIALSVEAAKASSSWGEFMSVAYQVRIELFKGNISYTEKLLKQMGDFSEKEIPYYKHHEFLSFCRYCIFNKHTKRVHEITDFMISEDLPVKRLERLIECYILKAIACYLDGDLDRSLNILEKAFQISENEGHVRLYIDEGENMQALFKECLKRKILPEYLNPYIENPHAKKTKIKISERKSIIINEFKENFNEREIEILKLMKKGNSNNQIADTLCLSINTVKWYSSRIYAKLNVKRRGEAVSFAEKYELI
ncbi:MAG: hypothetical protein GY834_11370 [Bacteroidetes bacterium]|nr:hypothetical protein [Bacteroidota bacterium]